MPTKKPPLPRGSPSYLSNVNVAEDEAVSLMNERAIPKSSPRMFPKPQSEADRPPAMEMKVPQEQEDHSTTSALSPIALSAKPQNKGFSILTRQAPAGVVKNLPHSPPLGSSKEGKGLDDWKKRTDQLAAAVLAAARVSRSPFSPPLFPSSAAEPPNFPQSPPATGPETASNAVAQWTNLSPPISPIVKPGRNPFSDPVGLSTQAAPVPSNSDANNQSLHQAGNPNNFVSNVDAQSATLHPVNRGQMSGAPEAGNSMTQNVNLTSAHSGSPTVSVRSRIPTTGSPPVSPGQGFDIVSDWSMSQTDISSALVRPDVSPDVAEMEAIHEPHMAANPHDDDAEGEDGSPARKSQQSQCDISPIMQSAKPISSGVGIVFREQKGDGVSVQSVAKGGAAACSSRPPCPGDILLAVSGADVRECSLQDLRSMLLGTEGDCVVLRMRSPSGLIYETIIRRAPPSFHMVGVKPSSSASGIESALLEAPPDVVPASDLRNDDTSGIWKQAQERIQDILYREKLLQEELSRYKERSEAQLKMEEDTRMRLEKENRDLTVELNEERKRSRAEKARREHLEQYVLESSRRHERPVFQDSQPAPEHSDEESNGSQRLRVPATSMQTSRPQQEGDGSHTSPDAPVSETQATELVASQAHGPEADGPQSPFMQPIAGLAGAYY